LPGRRRSTPFRPRQCDHCRPVDFPTRQASTSQASTRRPSIAPRTTADLDASSSPDWDAAIARYRADTAAARAQLAPGTVRYGARAREALDIYAPRRRAKRRRSWSSSTAVAGVRCRKTRVASRRPRSFGAGIVFVALDMTPLPECTLAELLNQARRAIKWLHAHVAGAWRRPGAVSISAATARAPMSRPCSPASTGRQCGLPHDVIKSATTVGRHYDLEPLQRGAHNDWLKLDRVAALRLSPYPRPAAPHCQRPGRARRARHPARSGARATPTRLRCAPPAASVETLVVPGHDHFNRDRDARGSGERAGRRGVELARG